MESSAVCPKCQGSMQEGFIPDTNSGMNFINSWVEGSPEKSLLRGVKVEGKRQYRISVFRCDHCGYLESYARVEVV